MLSIIVYGRNDSHGYNLHKRAAISLNCMAEVLTEAEDEIVFIDYNTPDDLPTFPEAIQDTLTPKAKQRLRTIRIRAEHHEELRHQTHLVALESRSRNAAIRRANPANRWVLSTNPDMILMPRHSRHSLSEIVGGLGDGCYHLPRFELPESLWESFDRLNPGGILGQLEAQGQRLHLNEVVYGSEAAIFDGHGDFQLLLRSDVEAIGGFHEGMIGGWHVDSNLAKRILLLRGEVRSLLEQCFGYHCDHTRMASVGHGRDRLENDLRRYYDDVKVPEIPEQAETWGLAGIELEEIRLPLSGKPIFIQALEAILPPMAEAYTEAAYIGPTFDEPHYPAEHVLPYLTDLLISLPRRSVLGWFGARPRMLALVNGIWEQLGFTGSILVAEDCLPALAEVVDGRAIAASRAEILASADLFMFEFGARTQDATGAVPANQWSQEDFFHLSNVRRAFYAMADHERASIEAGHAPRRVMTVNAIHTRSEQAVNETLSINRTPFSSRVRQGFVIAEPPKSQAPAVIPHQMRGWLQQRMGRTQPVPITEIVRLLTCAHEMMHQAPGGARLRSILRTAPALLALLDHPGLARIEEPERITQARSRIATERFSQALRPRLAIPLTDAIPSLQDFPCRIAATEDWEDEEFASIARRYFSGMFATNTLRRSMGIWARVLVVVWMKRLGRLDPSHRVLVVASLKDQFYDVLSEMVSAVDVLDVSEDGGLESDSISLWRDRSRVRFTRRGDEVLSRSGQYETIIFCRKTVFWDRGIVAGAETLAAGARSLRLGGMLAVIDHVAISGTDDADQFTAQLAASDGFAQICRQYLGLERLPAATPCLSVATLDACAMVGDDEAEPHLVVSDGDDLVTTALWIFIKREEMAEDGAARWAEACRTLTAPSLV